MRILARENRHFGEPELDEAGEALRRYVSEWIGEAAAEPAVAAGIARLAHVIQFYEGKPDRPRAIIRAALTDIGMVPAQGTSVGLETDEHLDGWCALLLLMADIGAGYDILKKR